MKQITLLAAVILLSFSFIACKKKGEDATNTSRTLRFEVTGNYSGSLFASYTTATGGTSNDPVSALPWNKEITYNSSVTAAIIAFSGNGGASGQQVTIVVKRGGNEVSSSPVTVGASGSFTKAAPVVTF